MTLAALALLPEAAPVEPSWEEMLLEAVLPEFQVEVYRAVPGDLVLHGPTCAVGGGPGRGANRRLGLNAKGKNRSTGTKYRGYLCIPHVDMWRRDGEPPINLWVAQSARALKCEAIPERCRAPLCTRSRISSGLCSAHRLRWAEAGSPDMAAFLPTAGVVI